MIEKAAIDPRLIYDPVARPVVAAMRCRRLRVQIKRRQNVLMMSVGYRRRAVALAWICLPHDGSSDQSQWEELLDYLATLLAEDI